MADNGPQRFTLPATKGELGFAVADTVLALKSMQVALLALRNGDQKSFDEQLSELDRHTDDLWKKFQDAMGPRDA